MKETTATRLQLGSTRALACSVRRPRRAEESVIWPRSTDTFARVLATGQSARPSSRSRLLPRLCVAGGGADHCTRGRVRSPIAA